MSALAPLLVHKRTSTQLCNDAMIMPVALMAVGSAHKSPSARSRHELHGRCDLIAPICRRCCDVFISGSVGWAERLRVLRQLRHRPRPRSAIDQHSTRPTPTQLAPPLEWPRPRYSATAIAGTWPDLAAINPYTESGGHSTA